MTWSLIARDPATGAFGIAVATKNFAVGCRVPHIASGIGAIASQALANPFYGVHGLRFLRDDMPPEDVIKTLTAGDEGREQRQVHLIDRYGRIAGYTGNACIDWCGHTSGENFSVAGNMLAGPAVIADTAKVYRGECIASVAAPPHCGDEGGRGGGGRQARQAIGSAGHLRRGRVAGPRPARRRSRRSARRTRTAREGQPRALGAIFRSSCRARRTRTANSTARRSTRISLPRSLPRRSDGRSAAGDRKPARRVSRRPWPPHGGGRRRRSFGRARHDARARRRVRLRQERHVAGRDGPAAEAERARSRAP